MKQIITLSIAFLVLSCQGVKIDSSPMSGTINQGDEKTAIVKKLAQAYQDGNFDIAKEYFTADGLHYFNNIEYTAEEIIDGYNFHSILYDDLKHIEPYITTMYYNNGDVFTNHWSDWSGKSKITGKVQKNTFHCWWQWEGNKIIATQCYFDTSDIEAETALYQEQNSSNN